jgi:hypothetical protein
MRLRPWLRSGVVGIALAVPGAILLPACSASPSKSANATPTTGPSTTATSATITTTPSTPLSTIGALPVLIATEPSGQQTWTGREPTEMDFSGDAGDIVTGITWSSWTGTQAVGNGTWTYQNCVPDCASGSQTPYPAMIVLSDPVNGVFTSITETTIGPHASTQTFTYPGNWVQNAS